MPFRRSAAAPTESSVSRSGLRAILRNRHSDAALWQNHFVIIDAIVTRHAVNLRSSGAHAGGKMLF